MVKPAQSRYLIFIMIEFYKIMNIQYKFIENEEELEKSRILRYKVFVEEQNIPKDLERDNVDSTSHHVIAVHGSTIVGTGRITIDGEAKISRLAVENSYRNHGIGRKIMQELENIAGMNNATKIHLSSNFQSVSFYILQKARLYKRRTSLHRMWGKSKKW